MSPEQFIQTWCPKNSASSRDDLRELLLAADRQAREEERERCAGIVKERNTYYSERYTARLLYADSLCSLSARRATEEIEAAIRAGIAGEGKDRG
jgi:hypothetical protein